MKSSPDVAVPVMEYWATTSTLVVLLNIALIVMGEVASEEDPEVEDH